MFILFCAFTVFAIGTGVVATLEWQELAKERTGQ